MYVFKVGWCVICTLLCQHFFAIDWNGITQCGATPRILVVLTEGKTLPLKMLTTDSSLYVVIKFWIHYCVTYIFLRTVLFLVLFYYNLFDYVCCNSESTIKQVLYYPFPSKLQLAMFLANYFMFNRVAIIWKQEPVMNSSRYYIRLYAQDFFR